MDLSKLTNRAATVIISDKKMLILQGKDGKWGFPSAVLGDDEKVDNAIINLSKNKLGVDVVPAAEIGSIEKNNGGQGEIVMFIHVNMAGGNVAVSDDYATSKFVAFDEFKTLDLAADEKQFLEVCAEDLKKHLS